MSKKKHKKKKEKSMKENIFESVAITENQDLKFSNIFRLRIKDDKLRQ